MKRVAIIQARMASTRLPGKVLKKVLDKPLIEYQLERVMNSGLIDEIVVATTYNTVDEPIIEVCKKKDITIFRGPEEDVLTRYYLTAKEYKADIIVRLTADCPIIDPKVIDKVVKDYLDHLGEYDYVSNTIKRTFPRGMDSEVFSFRALEMAYDNATEKSEREHVTPYIYKNPHIFSIKNVSNDLNISNYRITVDTIEDFQLIKYIIEKIYPQNPNFTIEDIIYLFKQKPELININNDVKQKEI